MLSFHYTGDFFPKVLDRQYRQSQHFTQEEVYQHLHDFQLIGDEILSLSHDPWILLFVNPNYYGNILKIDIDRLSVNSTSAQIFFAHEVDGLNEENSVRLMLRNGINNVILPDSGYALFRLDLTETANISMVVNEVVLANYMILPGLFWVTFIVLLLLCTIVLYLLFFKPIVVSRTYGRFQSFVECNIVNNSAEDNDMQVLDQQGFLGLFNLSRFYWICVIITILLCYGFTLTNLTIVVDDVVKEIYFSGNYFLMAGRWGYIPLQYVFHTYTILPFWRSFIAIILIMIGLTFFCGLYKKYSNGKFDDKAATIFTCVSISFPWIAHLFIFSGATIEIGLIIVFTGISLAFATKWILEKKHLWNFIVCSLSLGYATAFYEVAIPLFVMGGFSLLFIYFLSSKERGGLHQFLLMTIKYVAVVISGLFVWRLGATALQNIYGVGRLDYIGGFVSYDTTSISAFLRSFIDFVLVFLRLNIFRLPGDNAVNNLIWSATITLLVISFFLSIILKKIIVCLAGIVIVGSAYGIHFATGNAMPLNRITFIFFMLIAFTFAIIYFVFQNISYKAFKIKPLLIFLAVWVVFFQSREINQIFYLDYQRYQRDVMIMNTIIYDVGLQYKPIVFVGFIPDPSPTKEIAGISIFNVLRSNSQHSELFDVQHYAFFQAHNFQIVVPNAAYIDTNELRYRIVDMPSWPRDGYIREFEDYIIVRLGPSAWDNH